jgi:hypothetical protein
MKYPGLYVLFKTQYSHNTGTYPLTQIATNPLGRGEGRGEGREVGKVKYIGGFIGG